MENKNKKEQHQPEPINWGAISRYLGLVYQIGFTVIASMALFMFVGMMIDKWLKLPGIFMIIGIFAGAIGSFYSVYKAIESLEKK